MQKCCATPSSLSPRTRPRSADEPAAALGLMEKQQQVIPALQGGAAIRAGSAF
jgi:hypothetical protein